VQRPERKAASARGVGGSGQRLRFFRIDLGEGMQLAVGLGDSRQ
jgi:hypothetical protein